MDKKELIGKKCFLLNSPDPNINVAGLGMVTISDVSLGEILDVSLGEYSTKLRIQVLYDRYNCEKGKELRTWTYLENISIVNNQLLTQQQIELWNNHRTELRYKGIDKEELTDFYKLKELYNCFDYAIPIDWLNALQDHHSVRAYRMRHTIDLSWTPFVMAYPKDSERPEDKFGCVRPLTTEAGNLMDIFMDKHETDRILKAERGE